MEYEGSCYWFSSSVRSWTEADKYCQLENAHLVVVTSWDEQVKPRWVLLGCQMVEGRGYQLCFFPQKFVQHHMGPLNTWIGLTDQNGPWKWVDGTDYETGFK